MRSNGLEGVTTMNSFMTISEITSQFNGEWVLIEEPQTDEKLRILGGKVRHHSKDRDEVYRAAIALQAKRIAVIFTGQIPEDTALDFQMGSIALT